MGSPCKIPALPGGEQEAGRRASALSWEDVSEKAYILSAGSEYDNLGGIQELPEPVSGGFLVPMALCVPLCHKN